MKKISSLFLSVMLIMMSAVTFVSCSGGCVKIQAHPLLLK